MPRRRRCRLQTIRVSGVAGIVAVAAAAGAPPARADVFTNVPAGELTDYQLVYDWNIPDSSSGWNTAAVPYTTNNAASIIAGSYDRVAYYVQLDNTWVYASFNATGFLTDPTKLGVPGRNATNGTGVVSNMAVASMNVYSNVGTITTGTGITGGKLEFWGRDYSIGANGVFDHDDTVSTNTTSNHGSMQIHNTAVPQTLFGYSAWGTARDSELGIGPGPNTGGNGSGPEPDWTFNNANNDLYTTQRMQILVHVPEPAAAGTIGLLAGCRLLGRRRRTR